MILAGALALVTFTASAQRGFDTFAAPRTVVLATPQKITETAPVVTNGPVDIRVFDGTAMVLIQSLTNTVGTVTAQLYTSPDQTNLTALANYALATSTSITYTNYRYGTNGVLTAANTYLLPGVWTTPTLPAGFVSGYLSPAQFTNSGAVTITQKGAYMVGFNANDAPDRYLYIVWSGLTGTTTNFTVGATLTGHISTEVR